MQYLRGGKILRVNLGDGRVETEDTSRYDSHVGMRGINGKLLYDLTRPGVDALGPENVLIFGVGPLTGTMAPGAGRTEVTAKSPMTGIFGTSNIGGYWGAEMKFAGYDHVVFGGQADHPVYLVIDNDRVEIRDARHLWGKDTFDTPGLIKRDLGDPNFQVLSIGIGGENRVKYASILTKVGDAAGRTGMGAVMGSKNLKAIAVRGTGGVRVANPDRFYEACVAAHQLIKSDPFYPEFSTVGVLGRMAAPTKIGLRSYGNYDGSTWLEGEEPTMAGFADQYMVKRAGCFSCPVRCMEQFVVPGRGSSVLSCALYASFIWRTQVSDTTLLFDIGTLCQRYGIDSNSFSGMAAWAAELFQQGLLTESDTNGMRLVPGDRESIIGLLELVARRQGIGDILADDGNTAAARIGGDSGKYLMHVKGLPMGPSNQMNFRGEALAGAVNSRGDYIRSSMINVERGAEMARATAATPEEGEEKAAPYLALARKISGSEKPTFPQEYDGKAAGVAHFEQVVAVPDMVGMCKWHSPYFGMPVDAAAAARVLSAGAGQDFSEEYLVGAAKRLLTLERAYNVREGLTREMDTLPERLFTRAMPGRFPDDTLDRQKFEAMKTEFYAMRGWDPASGVPLRATLEAMELTTIADDLQQLGKLPAVVAEEAIPVRR